MRHTPILERSLILLSVLLLTAFNLPVQAADVVGTKLTGTPIGSPSVDYSTSQVSTTVNQPKNAFDGDFNTFYASYDKSNTWVGLDLGTPHVITRVGWCARNNNVGPNRVQLALFEGSNSEDFLDAVPLYLIPEKGVIGQMMYADINVSRGFRYVRYVGPNSARCNIGELEFYGFEGAGTDSIFYQVTNLPTVSIHTYSGVMPTDKDNDWESNITITYDGGRRIQEYPILTRCRGNASLSFPKKPYRFKFQNDKKHHMLKGSPLESPAKAKKWTLINNYGDKTLLRNILAFETSRRLGMPYTVYCQPVDVIMNGEYQGCYQLCDQISINDDRIPITEMTPYDTQEPELTGGYLIEVDAYASREASWFTSSRNIPVTIKSPDEDEITTEQKNYIRNYFNLMESSVFSTNFQDPSAGYRRRLDVESFLRHFLVGEFSGNTDTYWSTYMYKDRNQDYFTVAPSWDFDLAYENDNRIHPVNGKSNWVYASGGSSAGSMKSLVSRVLSDSYAAQRLKSIWKEMRDTGKFTEASLVGFVDSIASEIDASQRLNFIRWPILSTKVHQNYQALGSYSAELQVVRDYIPERIAWIDNKLSYNQGPVIPDSAFQISTPQDLIDFAAYIAKGGTGSTATLLADLDMTGFDTSFKPIGTDLRPFGGTFDGQGHRITNLHVSGTNSVGLFGVVTGGAIISNFIVDASCSISGSSYVGVVGSANGIGQITFSRIGNEATISASTRNAGGIIGCNYGSTAEFVIENCYNTGDIVGGAESGAFCGWVGSSATIIDCYNIGTVSGYDSPETYLYRGSATLINTYSTQGAQGIIVGHETVGSGELCYRLNESRTVEPVWRQALSVDEYPTFLASHAIVGYEGGRYINLGVKYGTKGDTDGDGDVDIADLNLYGGYILQQPMDLFVLENADMNADGTIDVFDIVLASYAITGGQPSTDTPDDIDPDGMAARIEDFPMQAGAEKMVSISGTYDTPVTALQADIQISDRLSYLPESVIRGTLCGTSHVASAGMVDGKLRILLYSTSHQSLRQQAGELMRIGLISENDFAGGTLTAGNQKVVTAEGLFLRPADTQCNVQLTATPVSEIQIAQNPYIVEQGQTIMLEATVLPVTASEKTLRWSISNAAVAKVTADGKLIARNSGHAIITASATDGSGVTATSYLRVLGEGDFEIASAEEFIEFSACVSKGYTDINASLTADIDMSGINLSPIGTEEQPFSGTFDGRGHTISHLIIDRPNETGVGLFGHITAPATIRNLVLDASCAIVGQEYAGLVGYSEDSGTVTLECLGNEGSVSADATPAGILGSARNSSVASITNCYSTGRITTITSGLEDIGAAQISGWLGNVAATVTNCWSTSEITGFQASGYAITTDRTFARVSGSKPTFTNCYSQVSKQVTLTEAEKFLSGEVTYLLNAGQTQNPVWGQTIGLDEHPSFQAGHGIVFKDTDGTYYNQGTDIAAPTTGVGQATTVYDLSGRKIANSPTTDSKLQKGLYIIGGRKVLVK
ncbi:MAG: CotH kinase family protein [Bacteroidaceae bacterium]|nr:CotH kinase family protein [Bacteroidaceae bacterium]